VRREDLAVAATALIGAVTLLSAARELPHAVRTADAQIAASAHLSPLERELAAPRTFALDPALVLRADQLLPRDAVFYVATGPGLVSGHDAAAPFSGYWLLPRRHTDDPRHAEWILSFGADLTQLGVAAEVVDDLGGGQQLLRVRR
jgi:hypothetical protein